MREMLKRFFRRLFSTEVKMIFTEVPYHLQEHVRNLSHPEDEKKLEALKALQEARDPSTIPFIGKLVKSGNRMVMHGAIGALGAMRYREAIGPLADALDVKDFETLEKTTNAITGILDAMRKQSSR